MYFTLLFALHFSFAFSKTVKDISTINLNLFKFTTSRRKEYTLTHNNLKPKSNLFKSLIKKILRYNSDIDQREWYYVHIPNNYISKVKKYVQLQSNDEIVKNTFILYLSDDQLCKIAQYCQIKKLEPSDKIDEICPINNTNYLYIKTSPGYNLLPADNFYSIEKKNSNDSYIIKIDQNRLNEAEFLAKKKEVAKLLSEIPAVKTVATYKKPVMQNNINVGLVQKLHQPLIRDGYTSLYKYDRYVHNHGLTGEGQIITIEDTPIDFRHPMFKDKQNEVEFNTEMKNHRKFVYYHSETDIEGWKQLMKNNDHGTHTAGTLAGKSIVKEGEHSMSQLFDGSAPDSKIVYVGVYGNVSAVEMEERMNKFGSRISSNSWGDDEFYVDHLNHEYGSLAQRNPQSLFVFAAGNHGYAGNFSIVDPGASKNVLSVAYSNNPVFRYTNQYTLQSMINHDLYIPVYSEFMFSLIETADFLGTEIGESKMIAVDARKDACEKMIGNHISVLYGASFDRMKAFMNECFIDESLGLVLAENISVVEEIIKLHSKVGIVFNTVVNETIPFEMGGYSSAGPGNKGIIKPDVIAPGSIVVSAKSYSGSEKYTCEDISTGCGISLKSGSSMATPNVAGAASLVSQYFKVGKWIDKTDIDGSTLRALIINSCHHPYNSKKFDILYGHGLVDISSILPLEGEFGVQISTQNVKPFVLENGHVEAKIEVKSNRVKLQITLSYVDEMLNENSPIPLTRDLDLFVSSPEGKIYVGDDVDSDTQHLSTNEKIIINEHEIVPGIYTVHVFGNSFFDSSLKEANKQEFAVVATGDIENKYISFEESTNFPCKTEKDSSCSCNENEIGPTCHTKIHLIKDKDIKDDELNATVNFTVESMQIYRIKFSLNKKIKSLLTNCESCIHEYNNHCTIWISSDCHLTFGEYDTNFKIDVNGTNITVDSREICVAIFNFNDMKSTYQIELDLDESDSDEENDKDKVLFRVLIGLICALVAAFICLVIVITYIVIKIKKEKNEDLNSLEQISQSNNLN